MYELFIGNKNYSSWSLRPWVLMKVLGIEFKETLMRFGDAPTWAAFRRTSGSGRVPMLKNGTQRAWDSLGIVEYLAERHAGVWPADPAARTWARCAAAEMHSGFAALREMASMNCGVRVKLTKRSDAFEADLRRLNALWNEGLTAFGGPFLAGKKFTAVDAFFAPVAFRVQTYGLELTGPAASLTAALLELPAMKQWYAESLAETFHDAAHEADVTRYGTVTEELRARA